MLFSVQCILYMLGKRIKIFIIFRIFSLRKFCFIANYFVLYRIYYCISIVSTYLHVLNKVDHFSSSCVDRNLKAFPWIWKILFSIQTKHQCTTFMASYLHQFSAVVQNYFFVAISDKIALYLKLI